MGAHKKYLTEEERKEADRASKRKWFLKNREKQKEYNKKWAKDHREYHNNATQIWKDKNPDWQKCYRSTKIGRASMLLGGYKYSDKIHNRGDCDLTAQWIVENIFSRPCHYCGDSDWTKIGCDRIDNSKPHTMDNVVPCCEKCNRNRGKRNYDDYINKINEVQ